MRIFIYCFKKKNQKIVPGILGPVDVIHKTLDVTLLCRPHKEAQTYCFLFLSNLQDRSHL